MISRRIEQLRREYSGEELKESKVNADPLKQFEIWFEEAVEAEVGDPHAMVLATASPDGGPSARVVLLRGIDPEGFTFYTNYGSRKAQEILSGSRAAVVFYWHELDRQVRAEGDVTKGEDADSDRYFASRPRASQIAAWASNQSGVISGRKDLDERYKEFAGKFKGQRIPRPDNWGGFKLHPKSVEFWQGRPKRLHDRIIYVLNGSSWDIRRLAP